MKGSIPTVIGFATLCIAALLPTGSSAAQQEVAHYEITRKDADTVVVTRAGVGMANEEANDKAVNDHPLASYSQANEDFGPDT